MLKDLWGDSFASTAISNSCCSTEYEWQYSFDENGNENNNNNNEDTKNFGGGESLVKR